MRRKTAPKSIRRPAGLQAMTPQLYAQVRHAIRALAQPAPESRPQA